MPNARAGTDTARKKSFLPFAFSRSQTDRRKLTAFAVIVNRPKEPVLSLTKGPLT